MSRNLSILGLAVLLAGCHTAPDVPQEVVARDMYQQVANALPRADFGWGTPPGVIEMTPSMKREGPAAAPDPVTANEQGFEVVLEVVRPRTVRIPYAAIREVWYGWRPLPNALLAPLIVLPLQLVSATVVFDGSKVDGFLDGIERDIARLESLSRELGMGGPWSHAQDVKAKLQRDAAAHGAHHVSLEFTYVVPLPSAFPYRTPARLTAEAFAWCQAHPAEKVQPNPQAADDALDGPR